MVDVDCLERFQPAFSTDLVHPPDEEVLRMTPVADVTAYSGRQKIFHWITAAAILAIIPAGIIMNRMSEGPAQDLLYDLHRSFGLVILALVVMRVVVRAIDGAPAPFAGLTPLQRVASATVHTLLYALMLVMPILGWAAMSAYGGEWNFFHLFMPPPLLPKDEPTANILFRAHEIGGFLMAGLVIVHIGAALFHRFIRDDGVIARMLPNTGASRN
jgi:cytochrome b561